MKIKFLGVRGSAAITGDGYEEYGGGTFSAVLEEDGDALFIDAGSGIVNTRCYPADMKRAAMLITHPHLDHICGLPLFTPAFSGKPAVKIIGQKRDSRNLRAQIGMMMRAPLWPVETDVFSTRTEFCTLPEGGFDICGYHVETMESNHPGGCTLYRISRGSKSVVFALDFEHGTERDGELVRFARGCDVLVYDTNYLPENFPHCTGWGHSTAEQGVAIARACRAGRLLCVHFGVDMTDEKIRREEARLHTLFAAIHSVRPFEEFLI